MALQGKRAHPDVQRDNRMSSKSCVHLGLPDRGSPLSSTVEFWVFTPLTTALPDNRCINKSDSYRQDFKSDRCQSHLCRTKLVWKSTFSTRRHSDLPAAARNLTSPAPLWTESHLTCPTLDFASPAPLWTESHLTCPTLDFTLPAPLWIKGSAFGFFFPSLA